MTTLVAMIARKGFYKQYVTCSREILLCFLLQDVRQVLLKDDMPSAYVVENMQAGTESHEEGEVNTMFSTDVAFCTSANKFKASCR